MNASFVTTHHVPTLSRSHMISLYALSNCLALSRSHTESRSLSHQLPHHDGIFLCQRLTLFPMHLIVCRVTGQFDIEPRTVRRTVQRTGNTHCCCPSCCCAHTVASTTAAPLMHHTSHRSSHQPCTATLILHHTAHHSAHQPLLHQSLLHQPLLHQPLLH